MKRILLDTNVVLDVLLAREPWCEDARTLWQANDAQTLQCYVSASSLTDIFYIAKRIRGAEAAREAVHKCLKAFEICSVTRDSLELAWRLAGVDFEDDLQVACATIEVLDAIVTRDGAGFPGTGILVLTPSEAAKELLIE